MKDITPELKDRAILIGWIAGLVLAASLLWSISFPFRAGCLMRSVNKSLALAEDERRLSTALFRPYSVPVPMGCWYALAESGSLFYVFAIMRDGILVPCGAEISSDGEVQEIVPLGAHARQLMDRIPAGLVQVYARRIEAAVAAGGPAK